MAAACRRSAGCSNTRRRTPSVSDSRENCSPRPARKADAFVADRTPVTEDIVLRQSRRVAALIALFILSTTLPSPAAQRRVNVSSNFFDDSTLVANAGDQFVWVWTAGSHTVTSGTDGSSLGDGTFGSGLMSGIGRAYAWKAPPASSGTLRYYCQPHFNPASPSGMPARLALWRSPVP